MPRRATTSSVRSRCFQNEIGEVARLRFLQGLEIDEIAEQLGKKRNAVDQSLHRSRNKLQELLA